MSKEIKSITLKDKKVTMVFQERNSWGTIVGKQQITISRWALERALREAEITVPWDRAQ